MKRTNLIFNVRKKKIAQRKPKCTFYMIISFLNEKGYPKLPEPVKNSSPLKF